MNLRNVGKFGSVAVIIGLVLLSGIGISAAASVDVKFYASEVATVPFVTITTTTQTTTATNAPYYIGWKQLNDVPDFDVPFNIVSEDLDNLPASTAVVLSWKRKGDSTNTRFVMSTIACRATTSGGTTTVNVHPRFIGLQADLELVPLKTITKAEFDTIRFVPLADGHTDTPQRMRDSTTQKPANDLTTGTTQGRLDWAMKGGYGGAMHAAYTASFVRDRVRGAGDAANSNLLSTLNASHWLAETRPELNQLSTTSAGLKAAFAAGKVSLMQTVESAYSLTDENCEELIEQYYDLGVRMLSFTHNPNSYLAAGNTMADPNLTTGASGAYEPSFNFPVFQGKPGVGITDLGRRALKKLTELGMVFDLSHSDDGTVTDGLAGTTNPIIGSHGGARGQFDHVRNFWDPDIIAIAKRGGIVCQNFYGDYMADPRGVSEVADQVDYIVELLERPVAQGGGGFPKGQGIEYVGVGTDFDGGTNTADLNDARYFYRYAKELLSRGYTAAEIKKMYGDNFFRVLDIVQANATDTRRGGSAVIDTPMADQKILGKGKTLMEISTREPDFSANITGAAKGRVIVDGIVLPSTLSGGKLTASLKDKPLLENWHVVTFEAEDSNGKVVRDTKIFFINVPEEFRKVDFTDPDSKTLINTIYIKNGSPITKEKIPALSSQKRPIKDWKFFYSDFEFNQNHWTVAITRSYRIVAVDILEGLDPVKANTKAVQDNKGKIVVTIIDNKLSAGDALTLNFIPIDTTLPTEQLTHSISSTSDRGEYTIDINNLKLVHGEKYVVMYENEAGTTEGFSSLGVNAFQYMMPSDGGGNNGGWWNNDDGSGCGIGFGIFGLISVMLMLGAKKGILGKF